VFLTAYHHSIHCELLHNEDATNQNNKDDLHCPSWSKILCQLRKCPISNNWTIIPQTLISPLTSTVFKQLTEHIFVFANTDINISCVTTHLVIHSMINLHFNVHFLYNFEGKSPNFFTDVTESDPILCSCRWVRSTYCVWVFHAFSRTHKCRCSIAGKHKGETIFHNPLLGQGE
jgi:hypothetical protein